MAFNLDDYEPVEVRLAKFWADHPEGRVITDLVFHDAERFIVRADVYRDADREADATGYASETVTSSGVNKTSALENCETSAIGRALANLGYAAKGRASREEMEKVQRAEPTEGEIAEKATNKLKADVLALVGDRDLAVAHYASAVTAAGFSVDDPIPADRHTEIVEAVRARFEADTAPFVEEGAV